MRKGIYSAKIKSYDDDELKAARLLLIRLKQIQFRLLVNFCVGGVGKVWPTAAMESVYVCERKGKGDRGGRGEKREKDSER